MSETSLTSLTRLQGNRNDTRNTPQIRRWLLALAFSLLAHLLLWVARFTVLLAEVPKMNASQSMTVSLIAVPSKTITPEAKPSGETKPSLPQPVKPKLPSKPKPLTAKPIVQKVEERAPPKVSDTHPSEATQEQKESSASPTAPAASSPQASNSANESPSGHFEGPKLNADYLHNPRPDYPAQAKRMGWEGRVVLRVEVLANGNAGAVSVARSSGHELLDEAALEAVRRWKFVPAKRDGTAVNSSVNVPINFNLKNE